MYDQPNLQLANFAYLPGSELYLCLLATVHNLFHLKVSLLPCAKFISELTELSEVNYCSVFCIWSHEVLHGKTNQRGGLGLATRQYGGVHVVALGGEKNVVYL